MALVDRPSKKEISPGTTLTQRTFTASMWSGIDVLSRNVVQFLVSIVLARLLTPAEFGTVALLYLFTGIASVLVDGGLSSAIIQRQDVTHEEESAVFWFNTAAGLLVTVALLLSAPLFVAFYDVEVLLGLTIALAPTVLINAVGSIHLTLLTKRTEFRALMKIAVVALASSGTVAVLMAWAGFGIWSLAAQALISASISTLLLWRMNPWRPLLRFSLRSLRRMWSFGGYLLVSSLLEVGYSRGYMVLVGRFVGVGAVGFYERADSTKQIPLSAISTVFSRVALPVFSRTASDPARLRRGMTMATRILMLINVPLMLTLIATAEPTIATVFGAQWLPSVPILRVVCLAGVFWPLHVINLNALLAQGHSRLFFRLEVLKKTLGVTLLIGGIQFGVMGVAWSQAAFAVAAFVINAHYSGLYLDYGTLDQSRDFLPVVGVGAVSALSVYLLGNHLTLSNPVELIIQLSVASVLFAGLCTLFRLKAGNELRVLLLDRAGGRHE